MKKVRATCPASCGELFQGVLGDREFLMSYTIDRHAKVCLGEDTGIGSSDLLGDKMKQVLNFLGPIDDLFIEHERDFPIGKGYSSSTADMASGLAALACFQKSSLSAEALSRLCSRIEPTDSVAFEDWTVIDPLSGKVLWQTDWRPELYVYILEPDKEEMTLELPRMKSCVNYPSQDSADLLDLFKEACQSRDLKKIGDLASLSARLNNQRLNKPYLEELIELAKNNGALGINVAHSGTVVGILLDKNGLDQLQAIEAAIGGSAISQYYSKRFLSPIIYEGIRMRKE